MTDTTTDPAADAAEPIETTAASEPPAPEQTAVERRPDVRPQHHGDHLIAGTELYVVPPQNEMEAIAQLAVTLAGAAAVPSALRGKPNDVFLVLMTARDLGMGLTTAMRECHVIEGKVTISPKAKLAMVRQQNLGRIWPDPDNDGESATWYAERFDMQGVQHRYTFTKAMAQAAGLLPGKDKSAWKTYPERMLSWRACGYLLDDVFSEVGTGLYSPDELGAAVDADGQVIIDVVGTAAPLAGMSAPRGHNQPAPPPEPPADASAIQALRDRIAVLGSHSPDARQALITLWTKPRSEDSNEPTLPPIQHLMAKQVKIADAMVASIEQRAKRGEWGPWSEPADASAPDAPSEPDPADGADATEPAGELGDGESVADPASTAPPAQTDDEVLVRTVIAEVKSLEPEKVDEQLAQRELDTSGRLDTRRHRLATAMIGERRTASA